MGKALSPDLRGLVAVCCTLLSGLVLAIDPSRNLNVSRSDVPSGDQRIALVIGNSNYKISPLVNPVNDARAISAKLRTLGFTVIERQNLTFKQIGLTMREFRSKLMPGAVALFFYAGHGLQVKGSNYLPVVDADIASEDDVSLQSLEVGKVLELMDEAKTRLNLVFLDACRNNPYTRSFRSAADGLAKVNAPSGTLISFATRPGSVAADGSGRNGLYTEHLLAAMDIRDQPIELALKRVVTGVKAASKGQQEPWMEGSIEGDFCFGGCMGGGVPSIPIAVPLDTGAIELAFWDSIKSSTDSDDFQAYLDKYPNGQFVTLAERRVKKKPAKPAASAATVMPLGSIIKDCAYCPEMIAIPGRNYEMGKHEVTQAQWQAVMGNNPSAFEGANQPVEKVSWNDIQKYLTKLNQKTGKQYRLPTEAEWEYACYGGSQTEYCGSGNFDAVAWYKGNSDGRTHPVGQKQANGYGLHDMSGNVWEWMENKYDDDHDWRVLRGGSWYDNSQDVRAASRLRSDAGGRGFIQWDTNFGFRLARTLP